jgi:hypothetical protein
MALTRKHCITTICCAHITAPDVVGGSYFNKLVEVQPSPDARDTAAQRSLWEVSARLTLPNHTKGKAITAQQQKQRASML